MFSLMNAQVHLITNNSIVKNEFEKFQILHAPLSK